MKDTSNTIDMEQTRRARPQLGTQLGLLRKMEHETPEQKSTGPEIPLANEIPLAKGYLVLTPEPDEPELLHIYLNVTGHYGFYFYP